jgi:hypothetical protein
MNKNVQGYITVNDYIDVIREAEASLVTKLDQQKQLLIENER